MHPATLHILTGMRSEISDKGGLPAARRKDVGKNYRVFGVEGTPDVPVVPAGGVKCLGEGEVV